MNNITPYNNEQLNNDYYARLGFNGYYFSKGEFDNVFL